MTESTLREVEDALGISLPSDYNRVMKSYPFAADSQTFEGPLPDAADALIELNRGVDYLPPHSFILGTDRGEETYFINLIQRPSPVYVFDYETGAVKPHAANIEAYVQKRLIAEEEIARDEENMARKRWWQIWR